MESIIRLEQAGVCYRKAQGFFKGSRSDFWALKSISFELHAGETLGVIGRNGAGKSTLLRLLSGIIEPDRGKIWIRPKLCSTLLSIGVGSHSTLSGRENAILNGMILGATKEHMVASLERIKDFSELGDFFEQPIYTYSSGMHARLGFATALEVAPDVLLIDEMLSVGDRTFRVKSGAAVRERLKSGKAAVMVSHDTETIRDLCSRAIWIEHGELLADGTPEVVMAKYDQAMSGPHNAIG
ncbi:MAG: ABC transporter ATP-binding protein [Candidatus Methylacidiphilales bacterium]|nr:ABC transporter ATP-binding protein [Candidatus Methylacidiphilales bacterium]